MEAYEISELFLCTEGWWNDGLGPSVSFYYGKTCSREMPSKSLYKNNRENSVRRVLSLNVGQSLSSPAFV